MSEITVALITACGGAIVAGVFSVVSVLLQNYRARKDKRDETLAINQEGIRELLYYRIKRTATKCLKDGYITFDGFEDIHRWFRLYHDKLGGNGYIDGLMEAVDELPKKERKDE